MKKLESLLAKQIKLCKSSEELLQECVLDKSESKDARRSSLLELRNVQGQLQAYELIKSQIPYL